MQVCGCHYPFEVGLCIKCAGDMTIAHMLYRVGSQVDQRANQLAYHLIASGISSGATVMLLLTRSPELVVSALAALKAGCAYSALPAGLPEEALRLILQDAAPALVITHAGLQASLPKSADAPRVFNFDSAPDAEALAKRYSPCPSSAAWAECS